MDMKLPVNPKVRDEALANYIFEQMIDEGKTVKRICEDIKQKRSTISRWLRRDHTEEYDNAIMERGQYMADKAEEVLDELTLSGDRADNAKVQAVRLKIDTLKWFASKLMPRRYGEKLQLKGNAEEPITIKIIKYSDTLTEDEERQNAEAKAKIKGYNKS